ncbi:MAG: protein translocase subunit SecD [Cellulosilyticum sp.]|nr:protein translocase subunit SecD [Cellulosilyticum sp.]
MKANNKKLKSIWTLIILLVIITCTVGFAYKACMSIGQDPVTEIEQVDGAENADSATDSSADSTEANQEGTENADESVADSDQTTEENTETTTDGENTADSESPEAGDELKGDENASEAVDSEASVDEEEKEDKKEEKKSFIQTFFDENKIKLGLDLQGGVNIVYEPQLDEGMSEDEIASSMEAAQALIQTRLDANGYTEAEVSIEGGNRLRVDIPGVDDPQKAINEIGAAGMLYFYDQFVLMEGQEVNTILTGKNIKDARPAQNSETGEYVVSIQLDDEGTKIFDEYTAAHQGENIFIYLDDTLLSYPTLSAHITDGQGQISGNFTLESAKALANNINAGALPFTLKAISAEGVGAKLGADALSTSLLAGMIGFVIILVYMLVMYRLCGLAASIALIFYVGLEILVLTAMNATLTLPGIAGILLSIGMAVDANVIIFARIKEELQAGKSVRLSVDSGFNKAFSSILDGNITTLIAATVLYFFGTGLIRSFATTLIVGIVISMFTALIITKMMLKAFVGMNIKKPTLFAVLKKTGKEA